MLTFGATLLPIARAEAKMTGSDIGRSASQHSQVSCIWADVPDHAEPTCNWLAASVNLSQKILEVESMTKINWVAADWGTTNLRVWGLNGSEEVVCEASSNKGMGKLEPHEFESALLELVDQWLSNDQVTPVIACGMVGASQGWAEAAYRTTPCTPLSVEETASPNTIDRRISVRIVPGIKQTKPNFDIMRGEETQIAGVLSRTPEFNGTLCLPGTHTKWVHISSGEVVGFQTFMTGELHEILWRHSILRHSLGDGDWDKTEFASAADATIAEPESASSRLFSIRASGLIGGLGPEAANGRLLGILIGAELAASRPFWHGRKLAIVGSARVAAIYSEGLRLIGQSPQILDAAPVTMMGLKSAIAQLRNANA